MGSFFGYFTEEGDPFLVCLPLDQFANSIADGSGYSWAPFSSKNFCPT